MRNFFVGQKVICIAKGEWEVTKKHGLKNPVKGEKYTVRDVYTNEDGEIGIRVFEIVNNPRLLDNGEVEEIGFSADEFKPLHDKKEDTLTLVQIAKNSSSKIH